MKRHLLAIIALLTLAQGTFAYRDLETGTFLTRDPIGYVDGPNAYCYVHCNPITKFDPFGLAAVIDLESAQMLIYYSGGKPFSVVINDVEMPGEPMISPSRSPAARAVAERYATNIIVDGMSVDEVFSEERSLLQIAFSGSFFGGPDFNGWGGVAEDNARNILGLSSSASETRRTQIAGAMVINQLGNEQPNAQLRQPNKKNTIPSRKSLIRRSGGARTTPVVKTTKSNQSKNYNEYWENLQKNAPVQHQPYEIIPKYNANGTIKSYTTYDANGNRSYQYEVTSGARHGSGYHVYDNSSTAAEGNGPRSEHISFD